MWFMLMVIADNMDFVFCEGFQGSYDVMTKLINAFEYNGYYKMKVLCEPQLGKEVFISM